MSDADRRAAQRAARRDPSDSMATAVAELEHARGGHDSELAWVQALIGQNVSIEGVRINYVGVLVSVLTGPTGAISSLVVDGSRTVWAKSKEASPAEWTQPMGEMLVPWGIVHHLTKTPKAWVK